MHDHHHNERSDDWQLVIAVLINVLLTLAQIVGGVISGSLSLIADALHNLGDAASLGIAVFARKIGRRPPNHFKTFGYKRAELIAALINLTTLIIIGLYLIYEAFWRFFEPRPIHGWIVIIVAGVGLIINSITAIITWRQSHNNINIRTAFLHNLSDAMTSVGVMIAGTLIILYQWYWTDTVLTLMISGYVLYQGYTLLPLTIHILMEGTPEHVSIDNIIKAMETIDQVESVHHVHVWQLDEHRNALEAHVVVTRNNLIDIEAIKHRLKQHIHEKFKIEHSTLEIELHEGPEQGCAVHGRATISTGQA